MVRLTLSNFQNEYGEYLVVTPDLGLFYPGIDNLYQFLTKTASKNHQNLPVAVNCCYFKGIDYTAIRVWKDLRAIPITYLLSYNNEFFYAQGLSMIAQDFVARNQKLVFYNVSDTILRVYQCSGYNNLMFCSIGENLNEYLFGECY